MSCTVAIANSPVFSPSRVSSSLFCKASISSSPETLTLSRSPSSPSPSSPLRFRLQKPPPSGLVRTSTEVASCSSSATSSSSSPTQSKRKRPAKLDIPVASLTFPGAQATPAAVERWREEVEVERDGYSVYCKRGRREFMEDRYAAVVDLQGDRKQAFFGIFDGHGGAKAAEFAAKHLDKNILHEVERRDVDEIEEAVKHGYMNTDEAFLREDLHGGTCCVSALIRKGSLVVSNAGDCRAVVSRGGIAEALTSDHRPSRDDEKKRIESLGGYVDCYNGVWRIQGSLAVSRGIGDRHLKQFVSAEPETKTLRIESEFEFLILASDGLWDKVSNQEAVDTARALCVETDKPEPLSACKKLVDLSVARGSLDDVSVMIIQLGLYR